MRKGLLFSAALCLFMQTGALASKIFIPMGAGNQTNHLKAYGIAFSAVQQGTSVDWLLNYEGGSFGMNDSHELEQLCAERHVSFKVVTDKKYASMVSQVNLRRFIGQVVKLEKIPKIAVYTPPNALPWDDAVAMALTYAGIPYDKIYADEVLAGDLDKYDWVHLFHEDFTGRYGKFWASFRYVQWYIDQRNMMEALAKKHGYDKVSQMQLAVAKKIKDFVGAGGNLFAMCAATETLDIALAADGVDICAEQFDGDAVDKDVQSKLNFNNTFAFKDFTVSTDAYAYGHSDLDNLKSRETIFTPDSFNIATPPGKLDAIPVMLCQNHTSFVKSFLGQTTAFKARLIKPNVMILGTTVLPPVSGAYQRQAGINYGEARYIHGEYGKGSWTYLSGHDPEDFQHHVGDPPTDLDKHPNSPGYRLILNNVLFPGARILAAPTVVMAKQGVSETTPYTAPAAVQNAALQQTVKMFPNPTTDELVVSLSAGNVDEVIVLNIAGKEVLHFTYGGRQEVNIPMKSLQSGMYMIKVNGDYAGKVVKE